MFISAHFLINLLPMIALAVFGWLLSLKYDNVTIVDTLWALFFLVSSLISFYLFSSNSARSYLLLFLVTVWALRLSIHLHMRNHNKVEDSRYQAIRARNEPYFRYKSLYLVFILQAILALVISLPLQVAIQSNNTIVGADYVGISLWILGMSFQVIGDSQLSKFKSNPQNKNKVLDYGLWRYTRHPNYFGEACIWFGYGFIAIAAGAWWTMVSPVFMTYLLIKVTGVKLLEADISKRRPDYKTYIKNTSSFFPWPPKN